MALDGTGEFPQSAILPRGRSRLPRAPFANSPASRLSATTNDPPSTINLPSQRSIPPTPNATPPTVPQHSTLNEVSLRSRTLNAQRTAVVGPQRTTTNDQRTTSPPALNGLRSVSGLQSPTLNAQRTTVFGPQRSTINVFKRLSTDSKQGVGENPFTGIFKLSSPSFQLLTVSSRFLPLPHTLSRL
jgi:hypothetical protein